MEEALYVTTDAVGDVSNSR